MAADNRALMAPSKRNRCLMELPDLDAVLATLPLNSLFRCHAVSNSLSNLIANDPGFAKLHFARSEPQLLIHCPAILSYHLIDLNDGTNLAFGKLVQVKPTFNFPLCGFRVTHSSNGLVLMENSDIYNAVHQYIVLNPVTGEYTMLPESTFLYNIVRSAFFYCPITNQFKVFLAFHRLVRSSPILESTLNSDSGSQVESESESEPPPERDYFIDYEIEIGPYSESDSEPVSDSSFVSGPNPDPVFTECGTMGVLFVGGSDSWEPLGKLPFSPRTIHSPCYIKKATHWLCFDGSVSSIIINFNYDTHRFDEIHGPVQLTKFHASSHYLVHLFVVGECLSIFDSSARNSKCDIWKMKTYGEKDSWVKEYVIDLPPLNIFCGYCSFKPAICKSNGKVVMVSGKGYIIFYNLLNKTSRVVSHPPLQDSVVVVHTPSFKSLRDVTHGSNLVVLNVASRFAQPVLGAPNYLRLYQQDNNFSE